jgi:hypothetical protein
MLVGSATAVPALLLTIELNLYCTYMLDGHVSLDCCKRR